MISEVKATVRTPDSVKFWRENVQLSQLLLREPLIEKLSYDCLRFVP